MAFEHSHDADVNFSLPPTSNTTTTANSNPAITQSYDYMPLGALSGDGMTSRSPPAAHRKTCADPRLLHNGMNLWPYSQQQHHHNQHHQSHHNHHDEFPAADGSRPLASAYAASTTSMPYQAHYHEAAAFDASPTTTSAWPAETGLHMSHAMFASAATPADANTGDALTPPDSDGVSSPDGTDWKPVKEEDAARQHQQQQPYGRPHKQRTGHAVRSNSPHMRPDGYKKKNAKFDIPADRDLMNIDSLMEKAKARGDEGELKILKTQKRLLRNREAALHSRQKKKDYTAALEVRNKQLEAELKRAKDSRDSFAQQATFMSNQAQQAKSQAMHAENERNLLETKVSMLEQSLCNSSTSMSSVSSSTGFTNSPDWSRGLVNDYADVTASPGSAEATLMLLMAGAANALPSSHRLHSKHLPDHVRAAAPAILNAIFQRAGEAGPNFGQPAHLPAAIDDCSAQALDQLVQPEPVTKFRELMTLASHSSS